MDLADALHVCSITASTEDDCDTRARIDVRRRDEGSGSVIDERRELRRHILAIPRVKQAQWLCAEKGEKETHMSLQAIAEHRSDITALGIASAEALCPANEFAVIDALLPVTRNARRLIHTISSSVMTRLTSMGTRTRDVLRLDSQLLLLDK